MNTMFEFTIKHNGITVSNGRIPFLPRIGEKIDFGSAIYKVKDIVYIFRNGTADAIKVDIYVEDAN